MMKRSNKVARFNVYANICDGRGTIKTNATPLLQRSVGAAVKAAVKLGASKEPLVVMA